MSMEIIVAIITAVASLLGVIITVSVANKLTLYRIEQLEKKVESHTGAVDRLTRVEAQIVELQHEIKRIYERIA